MKRLVAGVSLALALVACQAPPPDRAAAGPALTGPLTIAGQGSFFLGGKDVRSDTLSNSARYEPSGTIANDQVYVHYQTPVDAKPASIALIHGCCLTGKTWETTPDGRMGWDEYFVRGGYPTYVVDQASRGRSAATPTAINAAKAGKAPPDQLPTLFAIGRENAWVNFRFGERYPEIFPGMQFPVEAQAEFWKQMVPDWLESLPTPNPTVPALSELSKRLRNTVLVSHSQSGIYPFQTVALDPAGVAAIVSIEPGRCPAATEDVRPYLKLPVLVLFGDYIERSPRWSPRLQGCREFVDATNRAGGRAEVVLLPDVGFHGNSHMLMQDRNSLEVAGWLREWIEKHVR